MARPKVDPLTDEMEEYIREFAKREGYSKPRAYSTLLQKGINTDEMEQREKEAVSDA